MPQVGGVYPPNFNASISGQAVCGDGHVCLGAPGVQFGTVHAVNIYTAGGVPSAQSFGAPTVKATITRAAGSVASAQSFGVPTVRVVFLRSVGGVSSAQQFGTVTAKAGAVPVAGGGVPSAQSFGTLTVKAKITVSVSGVPPSTVGGVAGPPTTGLAGWYDASQLTLADGALVNLWPDLSGQGHHLESRPASVAGSPPSCKANGLNGKKVVHYTHNGDNVLTDFTGAGPYGHFFVVAMFDANAFPDYNGLLGAVDQYLLLGTAGSTVWYPPGGGGTGLEYRYNGVLDPGLQAPMQVWAQISLCRDQPYTGFSLQIGLDRTYPPRYWHGDVAEVITYDHKLSDLDRKAVEGYLSGKWLGGPAVGGPGGQFGTVTVAAVVRQALAGVASAQQFGVVAPRSAIIRTVGAVVSAQAFGAVTTSARITRAVSGVASAQSFGTVRANVRLATGGVSTAQQFGVPRANYRLTPAGISSAQAFGVPAVRLTTAVTVPGVASAQSFGAIRTRFTIAVGSVSSAQQFGTLKTAYRISVSGLASEQQFGRPIVYVVYLHHLYCVASPFPSLCGQVICGDGHVCGGISYMLEEVCDDLDSLFSLACLDSPKPAICGIPICGDGTLCGGMSYVTGAPCVDSDLTPTPPPLVLDLTPA